MPVGAGCRNNWRKYSNRPLWNEKKSVVRGIWSRRKPASFLGSPPGSYFASLVKSMIITQGNTIGRAALIASLPPLLALSRQMLAFCCLVDGRCDRTRRRGES